MIYIHNSSSVYHSEDETFDVKAAWKAIEPKTIRRTDRFIQLSLLGAYRAVDHLTLAKDTGLYMASGQGNLAVFKRLRDQRYIQKQPPKPVDFINSLSNTSGFYVAQYLKIEGKNLNVSRLGFVIETLLLLAQTDLESDRERQLLLGGVDELQTPVAFTRKTLGLCDDRALGEGSGWLLLSKERTGALASIEVEKREMDADALALYLKGIDRSCSILCGQRMVSECALVEACCPHHDVIKNEAGFYETALLGAIHAFLQSGSGTRVFIDTYNKRYRAVKVAVL